MKIGQQVICINDKFNAEQIKIIPNRPVEGKIYTIRDIFPVLDSVLGLGGKGVLLEEIINPFIENNMNTQYSFEPNFSSHRFKPILETEIKEEINNELKVTV